MMGGLLGKLMGRGGGGLGADAMSNNVVMQMRALLKQQRPDMAAQIDQATDEQVIAAVQMLRQQMAPQGGGVIPGTPTTSPFAPRPLGNPYGPR